MKNLNKKPEKNLNKTAGTKANNERLGWALAGVTVAGGAALSATLGLANYLVSQITKSSAPNLSESYTLTPYEMDAEFEEVLFPTANGRMLSGWYMSHEGERRTVISAHGHGGRKEDMLGISTFLWKAGFNVLMFDFRGHGPERMKGELKTLGTQELEDYLAAIDFIYYRFAEDNQPEPIIGACGGSLGAAVALVAAARDARIRAVWADSSFSSRREVIAHNFETATHLPSRPVVDTADWVFKLRTGQPMGDFSPVKEISTMTPRPIYFIHGGADNTTPVSHAHTLYAAAKGYKELWIEPSLEHCQVYFKFRQVYRRRAIAFFQDWLTSDNQLQKSFEPKVEEGSLA